MERSTSIGGVKSLRAMFEAGSDTNRGRSSSSAYATPDRPLSKVRAAFVEVEPSAKIVKKISQELSARHRNTSQQHTNRETESGKENIQDGNGHYYTNGKGIETVLRTATMALQKSNTSGIENTTSSGNKQPGKLHTPESSSLRDIIHKNTHDPSIDEPRRLDPNTNHTPPKNELPGASRSSATQPTTTHATTSQSFPQATEQSRTIYHPRHHITRPKSPKPSTTHTTPQRNKMGIRPHNNTIYLHRDRHPPIPATPSSKDSPGSRLSTGFIKPRPKSPTRPINLPSHLTAHTASSAAKHSDSHFPSVTHHKPIPMSRRTSIMSTVSVRPSFSTSSLMSRKTSTMFGPPPKPRVVSVASRRDVRAPDDSFLARMMRPTASSASKVHGKIEAASPHSKAPIRKGPSRLKAVNENRTMTPSIESRIARIPMAPVTPNSGTVSSGMAEDVRLTTPQSVESIVFEEAPEAKRKDREEFRSTADSGVEDVD